MKMRYDRILLWIVLLPVGVYGQEWNEADSVWLSRILSGKDTLYLRPEFEKAIREGSLIRFENVPGQELLEAPSELPILKDFSEYLRPDTGRVHPLSDQRSMPPSVYRLYVEEPDTGLNIRKEAYTPPPTRLIDKKEMQIGKLPVTVAVGGRNLYESEVVRDGQKRGTLTVSSTFYFSLEEVLNFLFSKTERNKKKNRKRDDTWRYYNAQP